MKNRCLVFALSLTVILAACGGGNPAGLGPIPSPTPTPAPVTGVNITSVSPASGSTVPYGDRGGSNSIRVAATYSLAQSYPGKVVLWAYLSEDGQSTVSGRGSTVFNQSGNMIFSPSVDSDSGVQKTGYIIVRLENYPDGDVFKPGVVIGEPAVMAWEFQFTE